MHQTRLQGDVAIVDPYAAKQLLRLNPLLEQASAAGGKRFIATAGRLYADFAILNDIVAAAACRVFRQQWRDGVSDQFQILSCFLRLQQHETRWRLGVAK